jgi:uncharacterized protein (DUF1499 family)
MRIMFFGIYPLISFSIIAMGCSGSDLGSVTDGRLRECPRSPNCVSTFSTDPTHRIMPIPFRGTLEEARERMVRVVTSMRRASIIKVDKEYLHLEYRSALFRFVDDVEFYFDEKEKLIHFRSASRSGYYDFGVNRRRMEKIRALYFGELK